MLQEMSQVVFGVAKGMLDKHIRARREEPTFGLMIRREFLEQIADLMFPHLKGKRCRLCSCRTASEQVLAVMLVNKGITFVTDPAALAVGILPHDDGGFSLQTLVDLDAAAERRHKEQIRQAAQKPKLTSQKKIGKTKKKPVTEAAPA